MLRTVFMPDILSLPCAVGAGDKVPPVDGFVEVVNERFDSPLYRQPSTRFFGRRVTAEEVARHNERCEWRGEEQKETSSPA